MTMIARLADGLPLAASVHDDGHTNSGRSMVEYQNQAKQLFRRMNGNSPVRGTVETGPYLFHYFIDRDVCYLTMCDQAFSKRTAFSYLEELNALFYNEYGNKIQTVARPYSFIEFDSQIQKTKKQYLDSRKSNYNKINNELQEVHKIMVQNIEDVLQRGDALTGNHNEDNNSLFK
jgi:vesicle transport protein SEC22